MRFFGISTIVGPVRNRYPQTRNFWKLCRSPLQPGTRYKKRLICSRVGEFLSPKHLINNQQYTKNMSTKTPIDTSTLPPLSGEDLKIFNTYATIMQSFHNRFREYWNDLWTTATTGTRPNGMSVRQLIRTGLDFTRYLTGHHNIEEARLFPELAKKMPEFSSKNGKMCQQHKQIHDGLTDLQQYLFSIKKDSEFDPSDLKSHMESWGSVLWAHLDDEVAQLGAENMRKYWTKPEMIELNRLIS